MSGENPLHDISSGRACFFTGSHKKEKIDYREENTHFLWLPITLPFYDMAQLKQDQTEPAVQPGPAFICLHHQLNLDRVTN